MDTEHLVAHIHKYLYLAIYEYKTDSFRELFRQRLG